MSLVSLMGGECRGTRGTVARSACWSGLSWRPSVWQHCQNLSAGPDRLDHFIGRPLMLTLRVSPVPLIGTHSRGSHNGNEAHSRTVEFPRQHTSSR